MLKKTKISKLKRYFKTLTIKKNKTNKYLFSKTKKNYYFGT